MAFGGPSTRLIKYGYRGARALRGISGGRRRISAAYHGVRRFVRNGNNTARFGKGRISFGPQRKHYNRMSRRRRYVDRIHIHIERGKGGFTYHGRRASHTFFRYGSWG